MPSLDTVHALFSFILLRVTYSVSHLMNHQYKFVLMNIQRLSTKGKTKPVFASDTSNDMRLPYTVMTLTSFFPNFCNIKINNVSLAISQK